jgi:tetratricopeptide (TPR) repeat protein
LHSHLRFLDKVFMIALFFAAISFLVIQPLAETVSPSADKEISVYENYDDKLDKGVDAFYRTDWVKASRIFAELRAEKPKDPMPVFFQSMLPFWEYFFIDQSEESAKEFLRISEEAVALSREQLEKSPGDTTMVLLLSGLYGYRSLVAAGESNYRVAMQSGVTGFSYTRRLLSLGTDRPDARIGRGMFYYMVGSVPSGMRWATNMAGLRGNIEQGFSELKIAAESDSYVSNDAKMMLMYLYDKENRHEEALVYAELLTEKFPENVIFKYKKALIHEKAGNIEPAAALYREVVEKDNPSLKRLTENSKERISELKKLSYKH